MRHPNGDLSFGQRRNVRGREVIDSELRLLFGQLYCRSDRAGAQLMAHDGARCACIDARVGFDYL